MATVRIGGDPENYMEAPQLTVSDDPAGNGVNLINGLFDLLGIHRRAELGPKKKKNKPGAATKAADSAGGFIDKAGAALASQDLANYQPVGLVDLPPSIFAK